MSSKYKYFPILLQDYTSKSTQPVLSHTSDLLSFHYSRKSEPNLYISSFMLNPFSDDQSVAPTVDMQSLIPATPNKVELINALFRGVDFDQKTKEIILPLRHNSLPYLFIPHDTWWEYENFQKFPDYDSWYTMKFKEWHKHIIMKDYDFVCYDPMWSIDPKEPYYDLYMYYYSTTLKYYRPWKIPLPTQLFYESNRKMVYFMIFFGIYLYYTVNHLRSRPRDLYILMNEDWWVHESLRLKQSLHKDSPFSQQVGDIPFDHISSLFLAPMFNFRYGPNTFKKIMQDFESASEITRDSYYEEIKK